MRKELDLMLGPDGRSFSLTERENGSVRISGATGSVEINGEVIHASHADSVEVQEEIQAEGGNTLGIHLNFPGEGLTWHWELTGRGDLVEVTGRIRNDRASPVTVGVWDLVQVRSDLGGCLSVGINHASLRFFRWRMWDMRVELLESEGGRHDSENLCHLYDPESGLALLCGFTTVDRLVCTHRLQFSREEGIEEYAARCDAGGVTLPPGGELVSEKLSIGVFTDPYEALEKWADIVNRNYTPAFDRNPSVGWCGGGWIDAFSDREDCWEKVALDNAGMIRRKLRGFEVEYIWTSQHNLKNGIPGNWLTTEETQIPSGLPGFFRKITDLGFVPGLWLAPFWFYENAEGVLAENLDNILRDGEGEPICDTAGWEFNTDSEPDGGPRLRRFFLDGTHPGTEAYLRKVLGFYLKTGVRYYMLDFLGLRGDALLHDPHRTPLESARSILRVIRDSAGRDTHLLSAVASSPGFTGIIDAARIGRDFGEGRPLFPPFAAWGNATYPLHDLHFGNLHYFLQNIASSYFTHRRLYANDFNLLTIDKPIPSNHARVAVTVFGLGGGSPLMLGDDYRSIDPERLRMVKMCLPRRESMPRPVDLFDSPYPDGYCHMLKLSVDTAWDSYLLLGVFATDDESYEAQIEFERLGLDPDAAHRVFEFWNQEYVGTFRRGFGCRVPGSDCRLFRISRARDYPWLLSTDLHVQQGAVEMESLVWNQDNMELTATVSRPAGETGNIFILMPRRYRLVNHEGTHLMKEVRDMNVVVRRRIRFSGDSEDVLLRFQTLGTNYLSRAGWLPYSTEREWLEYVNDNRLPGDSRVIE